MYPHIKHNPLFINTSHNLSSSQPQEIFLNPFTRFKHQNTHSHTHIFNTFCNGHTHQFRHSTTTQNFSLPFHRDQDGNHMFTHNNLHKNSIEMKCFTSMSKMGIPHSHSQIQSENYHYLPEKRSCLFLSWVQMWLNWFWFSNYLQPLPEHICNYHTYPQLHSEIY